MIDLDKNNVAAYVASRLDFFNINNHVTVSFVGEGNLEEDGDGFINYVFRVSDGTHHLIVKQCRNKTRSGHAIHIDPNRYKLEYRAMQIRKAIVPDLLPDIYDCDDENRVIITEDVSRLSISRFQLMKGVTFPCLADHMARYMAATEFYTSEYYMESQPYRELGVYFTNTTMRRIMDVGMFLTSVVPEDTVGHQLDPEFAKFSKRVAAHPDVLLARQKLRHLFMSKGECLIHGDLHTSNVFADAKETKVIDMEYAFCGPFSYDLGYFTANFLAQYESACFRPFDSEKDRENFKAYCLSVVRDTYLKFCDYFISYCHEDSKPEYQNIPGLDEDFRLTTLREFIGFAASAQLGRIVNAIPYADYDEIEDFIQRHNAKCMSILVCMIFLKKWETYTSIDQIIDDIKGVEEIYCRNIKELGY